MLTGTAPKMTHIGIIRQDFKTYYEFVQGFNEEMNLKS